MMVFLIGITGVGKSSIGKMLAKKMKCSFVDLDAWIEVRTKKKIGDLFQEGEATFRRAETESLKSLSSSRCLVVATGGGIITREENIEWMRQHGLVIHLERPIATIASTINVEKRPLLKENPGKLLQLYEERKDLYKKARHKRIYCMNRKKAILQIMEEVKKYENKST